MPRHHPCLAPLPAPLGLRFRALLGLGFVPPPEPRPCAHCASIAYALLPAARVPLCRHRADPALIAPPHRAHRAPTSASRPISLSSRCGGPRALTGKNRTVCIPFSPNARKRPPFLATSARNACFSRSGWQHPRPMHPFPGAIGRFGIHGARILPPRGLFRVEEPEITHGAKMLPAPPGLSPAAACGPAERALRHATAACDTRHGRTGFAPCGAGLACLPHAPLPSRPRSSPPSYMRRASPPASHPPCPAICHAAHCGRGEPPIGLFLLPSCCPHRRIAPTAAAPAPPEPQPEPTGPRP